MFTDIRLPFTALMWFLFAFLVIGTAVWGALAYHLWKESQENRKRIQEQMIYIKRFEDDGK